MSSSARPVNFHQNFNRAQVRKGFVKDIGGGKGALSIVLAVGPAAYFGTNAPAAFTTLDPNFITSAYQQY